MNPNEMPEIREKTNEEEGGGKSRKSNMISFVVCVLIAFALWLIIMNVDDKAEEIPDGGGNVAFLQGEVI